MTPRQEAIARLTAIDNEVERRMADLSERAKVWATAQRAADQAWLALLAAQVELGKCRHEQHRARLILIATPEAPADAPPGSKPQA